MAQANLSPVLLSVLIVLTIILVTYNIWLDYSQTQTELNDFELIKNNTSPQCYSDVINVINKIPKKKKQSNLNRLMASSVDGALRGCLVGGLLNGASGAVVSGIAFSIVNPVMLTFNDSIKDKILIK